MGFKICFLFLPLGSIFAASHRKYDLNEESVSLFGSNLTDVLNRFRRTPEYLDILMEKSSLFDSQIHDMIDRNADFYTNMMNAEIAEKIKQDFAANPSAFRARGRRLPIALGKRRNQAQGVAKRRQNAVIEDEGDLDPEAVLAMDKMYGTPQVMKASEKNEWRLFAFEYLPRFIESLTEPLKGSPNRPTRPTTVAQDPAPPSTAAPDAESTTVDDITPMKDECEAMKRQGTSSTRAQTKPQKTAKNNKNSKKPQIVIDLY